MVPELRQGERAWFYEDVVFDLDVADDAVEELALAATSLGDALALVEADVPVVAEDWDGATRAVFDDEMSAVLAAGHQLLGLLLAAGTAVVAASEGAQDEQRDRERLRSQAEAEADAAADAGVGSGDRDPGAGAGSGAGGRGGRGGRHDDAGDDTGPRVAVPAEVGR